MKLFNKLIFFICVFVISLNAINVININLNLEIFVLMILFLTIIYANKNSSDLLEYFKAPLGYNTDVGYDNIKFDAKNFIKRKKLIPNYDFSIKQSKQTKDCNWKSHPCNSELYKKVYIANLNGDFELNNPNDKNLPPIDGKKGQKKMFMLANNKCSLECCPSTFSCDKGCVCMNQDQRDFINLRGKNRYEPKQKNKNLDF